MKTTALLLIALSLVCWTASADLIITEVMSNSGNPGGRANGDWFELYNSGGSAVDITFYSWDDAGGVAPGGGCFTNPTFLTYSLAAFDTVIICEESQANVDDSTNGFKVSWGLGAEVDVIGLGGTVFQNFSSAGDSITVWDASSVQVAQLVFGASTASNSMAWDAAGGYLGQSQVGLYGAYLASGDGGAGPGRDVASPGYVAIPEPSTIILTSLSLALLGFCQWRRRLHGS